MLRETGSSMLMFYVFLNKLQQQGHLALSKENPKALLMDSHVSNYFTCGRDEKGSPYIGVQPDLLPFFVDIPWCEACIDNKNGYLYLIVRNMEDHEVLLALGFKVRKKRLNVIFDSAIEKIEDCELNIKKIQIHQSNHGVTAMISNEPIYTGIKLRLVESASEIASFDANEFDEMLSKSGVGESYTFLDL